MSNSTEPPLPKYDVAIIGGGFSGVATLFHLLKLLNKFNLKLSCILFEPREILGAGIAYQTQARSHILNVPASKMSIDETDPDSFNRWLSDNSLSYTPNDFVPRFLYQKYLVSMLELNIEFANVKIIKNTITEISPACEKYYILRTPDGLCFKAKNIILAIGNSPNGLEISTSSVLQLPWDQRSLTSALNTNEIGIIGTGLSAVDVVVELESQSFQGNYTLISRHGLLPQSHIDESTLKPELVLATEEILKQLAPNPDSNHTLTDSALRKIIKTFRNSVNSGTQWQHLLDALRPHYQNIWQQLSLADQRKFIRHLRPIWSSQRHRIPATSFSTIEDLIKTRRLRVVRAKVLNSHLQNEKTFLTLSAHGTKTSQNFDLVFDCTGLWSNLSRCKSPLIESLINNNLATYDKHALGLSANADSLLLNQARAEVAGIYTLASLRRGELWETSAVREIRLQAENIARRIIETMKLEQKL